MINTNTNTNTNTDEQVVGWRPKSSLRPCSHMEDDKKATGGRCHLLSVLQLLVPPSEYKYKIQIQRKVLKGSSLDTAVHKTKLKDTNYTVLSQLN